MVSGRGRLQTVDAAGFAEHPLAAGALVWFDPGVIHRVVNDGDLEVRVIMQNAGLPEAGDAVMTFPDDVLADPARYRAAATLPGADRPDAERLAAALARRDLAVRGFLALFDADGRVDADPARSTPRACGRPRRPTGARVAHALGGGRAGGRAATPAIGSTPSRQAATPVSPPPASPGRPPRGVRHVRAPAPLPDRSPRRRPHA